MIETRVGATFVISTGQDRRPLTIWFPWWSSCCCCWPLRRGESSVSTPLLKNKSLPLPDAYLRGGGRLAHIRLTPMPRCACDVGQVLDHLLRVLSFPSA